MSQSLKIHKCELIDRPNRFLGRVKLYGETTEVFIPNPGRMYELMIPGKEVYIREASHSKRKTAYDMIGMDHEGVLISIDSFLPNRFVKELLHSKVFEQFNAYDRIFPEPCLFDGRLDFRIESDTSVAYLEVKSCTLVENGHARFPDAPTSRGARHLRELARAKKEDLAERAAVIFVIQRPDAEVFSPNDDTDPDFGNALRESHIAGVEIYALSCRVVDWNLELIGHIPVDLNSPS
ncbi:MAG: DNA/RNA nuclease SfsA [Candidatus Thorarchaeota archaeon]